MGASWWKPRRRRRSGALGGLLVVAALGVAGCASSRAAVATTVPQPVRGQARCDDQVGDVTTHFAVNGVDQDGSGLPKVDLRSVTVVADGSQVKIVWTFTGDVWNLELASARQPDTYTMSLVLTANLDVSPSSFEQIGVTLDQSGPPQATVHLVTSDSKPAFGPDQPIDITSTTPSSLTLAVPLIDMPQLPARFTWNASSGWIGSIGSLSMLSELDDCGTVEAPMQFPGTSRPATPTSTPPMASPPQPATTPATTTGGTVTSPSTSTAATGTAPATTTGATLGPPNAGPQPVWASNPPVSGDQNVTAVLAGDPSLRACPAILPVGDGPPGRLDGWASAGPGHAQGRWVLTDADNLTFTIDAYATLPAELQPPYHGDPAMMSIQVYGDGSSVVQPDTRGQFVAIITPAGAPCHWVLTLPDNGPGEVGQFMFGVLQALRVVH